MLSFAHLGIYWARHIEKPHCGHHRKCSFIKELPIQLWGRNWLILCLGIRCGCSLWPNVTLFSKPPANDWARVEPGLDYVLSAVFGLELPCFRLAEYQVCNAARFLPFIFHRQHLPLSLFIPKTLLVSASRRIPMDSAKVYEIKLSS